MAPIQAPISKDFDENAQLQNLEIPDEWAVLQDNLAASSGLSLLLVNGRQPPALQVSNNNSICQAFQTSPSHSHYCEKYCGLAHQRVSETKSVEHFRCHAGLHCFVTPVETNDKNLIAMIGGRAFLSGSDYRRLVERLLSGDLKGLFNSEILQNIIFSNREKLDELLGHIKKEKLKLPKSLEIDEKIESKEKEIDVSVGDIDEEQLDKFPILSNADSLAYDELLSEEKITAAQTDSVNVQENQIDGITKEEAISPQTQMRIDKSINSRFGERITDKVQNFEDFYLSDESKRNYVSLLKHLTKKQGFTSISLLVRHGDNFIPVYITGRFRHSPIQIQIDPWDERLFQSAKNETSIVLKPISPIENQKQSDADNLSSGSNIIELFPMIFHEDVLGVLLVGQPLRHAAQRREVAIFCREAALQLEIIRLNIELDKRSVIFGALQRMAERVNTLEPKETYRSVITHSSELLGAQRASLLLFDEETSELEVKAASGPRAKEASLTKLRLGEGIAGKVFEQGRPFVVDDISSLGFAASSERNYKSNSFISYPLIIGGRKLGVLNLTDKADGGKYDERDLKLIDSIAPHLALAIGRAEWQEKATEFELMSITDPLTGLLNRRYLEERIEEEVIRSQRNNYQMSFLMIDIDDFKFYNDHNGHQAGDRALEITAHCIKSVLRADDVAARYGGEEFSILLPQTSIEEALIIAERIRQKIESEEYPSGANQPTGRVTVSIGAASYSTGLNNTSAIIGAADRALYTAKSHNKNTVKVFNQPSIPFFDATENSN